MSAIGLDHCAVGVSDWDAANAFWQDVVGAELVELPRGVWAYRFGDQLVTVHGPGSIPDPAHAVSPGGSHVAFVWSGSIAEAVEHLERRGVTVERGPVARGAVGAGQGKSVYFRDPDGSLLEFVVYGDRPSV